MCDMLRRNKSIFDFENSKNFLLIEDGPKVQIILTLDFICKFIKDCNFIII